MFLCLSVRKHLLVYRHEDDHSVEKCSAFQAPCVGVYFREELTTDVTLNQDPEESTWQVSHGQHHQDHPGQCGQGTKVTFITIYFFLPIFFIFSVINKMLITLSSVPCSILSQAPSWDSAFHMLFIVLFVVLFMCFSLCFSCAFHCAFHVLYIKLFMCFSLCFSGDFHCSFHYA